MRLFVLVQTALRTPGTNRTKPVLQPSVLLQVKEEVQPEQDRTAPFLDQDPVVRGELELNNNNLPLPLLDHRLETTEEETIEIDGTTEVLRVGVGTRM